MVVYISGPMTGYPDHNKAMFAAAAASLRGAGHTVISPAELDHNAGVELAGTGWEATDEEYESYLDRDLIEVARADAIAFLPGWSKSGGAGREGDEALQRGMPMYLWLPDTPGALIRMSRWLFTQYRTINRLRQEVVA